MSVKEQAVLSVLGLETEVNELRKEEVFKNLRRAKDLKDIIDAYEKELRDVAFKVAEQEGEADDKGSYFVKLPDGSWFKKEARTSVAVNQEKALALFRERGLYDRMTPDVSSLDPVELFAELSRINSPLLAGVEYKVTDAELEQAFYTGEISDEELQALVDRKTTYALKVQPSKK